MESILWLPLTDYHTLSPICHLLSCFSFAFYIARTQAEKIYNFNIKFRSGVSKYAWFGLEAFVMGFLLQSASDKNINIKDKWIELLSLCY